MQASCHYLASAEPCLDRFAALDPDTLAARRQTPDLNPSGVGNPNRAAAALGETLLDYAAGTWPGR